MNTLERYHVELPGEGLERPGSVIRYGHWGQPVLALAAEKGRAWDFENNGMIAAVGDLIDAGRVRLYCVDSFDHLSWSDDRRSPEELSLRHRTFRSWITDTVMPWIADDTPASPQAVVTGCGMGARHALDLTLSRGDLFPVAICLSGTYDAPTPDWGRPDVHVVLTVGQGAWEIHPTSALPSTLRMSALLTDRQVSHDLDVWGPDASHDWPSWRQQLARHLPRFC